MSTTSAATTASTTIGSTPTPDCAAASRHAASCSRRLYFFPVPPSLACHLVVQSVLIESLLSWRTPLFPTIYTHPPSAHSRLTCLYCNCPSIHTSPPSYQRLATSGPNSPSRPLSVPALAPSTLPLLSRAVQPAHLPLPVPRSHFPTPPLLPPSQQQQQLLVNVLRRLPSVSPFLAMQPMEPRVAGPLFLCGRRPARVVRCG